MIYRNKLSGAITNPMNGGLEKYCQEKQIEQAKCVTKENPKSDLNLDLEFVNKCWSIAGAEFVKEKENQHSPA